MPDLGNRANVMGPQPLGPIRKPDPVMMDAIDRLLSALMAGRHDEVLAMTAEGARDQMTLLAHAIKPGAYDKKEIVGKARIVEHYFVKARLTGPKAPPFTLQFRIGAQNAKWTVREVTNLTDMRSAWTK
ncbi:MAG: hypothetical protein ACLQDV_29595 [Candidatus Binataceae bacterium]